MDPSSMAMPLDNVATVVNPKSLHHQELCVHYEINTHLIRLDVFLARIFGGD